MDNALISQRNSVMRNVKLKLLKRPPPFRKIAFGTWKTASEASVYAMLDIDMTHANAFMSEYSHKHQIKVTPTHFVGFAMAQVLKARPEINGMIRFGRIYLRENVDLFFSVNVPGDDKDGVSKANLSGTTLYKAEDMTLADIAKGLTHKASKVKSNEDKELKASFKMVEFIPWRLMNTFLHFVSWLIYSLNINMKWLGLPRDPFGSILITNIGGLGVDAAWPPLVPYSRIPILMAPGAVRLKPVVVDGEVVPRPVMTVGVTFDHRFMDGVHAGKMNKHFLSFFEKPHELVR